MLSEWGSPFGRASDGMPGELNPAICPVRGCHYRFSVDLEDVVRQRHGRTHDAEEIQAVVDEMRERRVEDCREHEAWVSWWDGQIARAELWVGEHGNGPSSGEGRA